MTRRFGGWFRCVPWGLFSVALAAGCATQHSPVGQVTQWSVYRTPAGFRDYGRARIADVLRWGDTGIGYLNGFDGELVFHRGRAYQVRADGNVYQPPPYDPVVVSALVCPFSLDIAVDLPPGADMRRLEDGVARAVPEPGTFCALRVVGRFETIQTATLQPAVGSGPPRPRTNTLRRVSGTMTGFRLPTSAPGLHEPGFQLVFLSNDLLNGGRVIDFQAVDGTVEIDTCGRFLYINPGVAR